MENFSLKYDHRDPYLLDKIVNSYSLKIVGEENNIKLLFCACISKDLPKKNRFSVIITSQSSAGKSNLVNTILEPFKDDVLEYTDFTEAFLKRSEFLLNGKIFKIEQLEKTNDKKQASILSLKFLLSEGILKIGLVDVNEKGKKEPKILQVNGIPVFISTSTNYNIDPETRNRTFLMQIDESQEQTKKIIEHTFRKYSTLSINDTWDQEVNELQKLVNIYKELSHQITDILIPFGEKLIEKIPTSNIEIRRDLAKILNLTCVITFIHASNRIRIRDNEGKDFIVDQWANTENRYTYALIAEPSDFKEALQIGGETIKQTLNKINKSSMEIYSSFSKVYSENSDGVKVKDVAKEVGLSDNRTRELMNQLANSGFLVREKSGRENIYFPTSKKFENITVEDFEFTKEELEEYLNAQIANHSGRLEVLYPSGNVVV